jgi:hypothetical protein
MNTADITCDKMTERVTSKCQNQELATDCNAMKEFHDKRSMDYNDKNKWYDRVYLCWEDTNVNKPAIHNPIMGFKCYRYSSFENADYTWNNLRETEQKLEVRHTMIPMCKWVPEIFDKYILDYKLKNMYWLSNHTMGRGYNRYK